MALVIVSGLACSGRTSRCRELIREFCERVENSNSEPKLRITHLSMADANVSRQAYATQAAEKPARAAYLSLVMRSLAKDAIVIADGGPGTNIKGFRYQLWCAAREIGVRCISVLCVSRPETCKARNDERKREKAQNDEAYDNEVLDDLLIRFEEPNAMTRWDSPLFVLDCNTSENEASASWEEAPMDAIWAALTTGHVTKAPDVVAPSRGTSSNYLSLLETTTQLVLSSFQSLGSSGMLPEMGGEVRLSVDLPQTSEYPSKKSVQVPLQIPAGTRTPSTATLQRLRRQFIKMHATGAATQNEIGLAMGVEGRRGKGQSSPHVQHTSSSPAESIGSGQSRAERKTQQQQISSGSREGIRRSPEEEVMFRFAAYLEEAL